VAVACVVEPAGIEGLASATDTLLTAGGVTVIAASPAFPSLVAVMVALPGPTAVTNPVDETVATAALEELQETVRPVNVMPPASRVVAVTCAVLGTAIDATLRDTATDATAAVGCVPPSPPPPHAFRKSNNVLATAARAGE